MLRGIIKIVVSGLNPLAKLFRTLHSQVKSALFARGYIGHGVSATFNMGRTLAELIFDMKTPRTDLFFVGRKIIPFPPEPFRFVLSHAIRGYMRLEDKFKYGEKF